MNIGKIGIAQTSLFLIGIASIAAINNSGMQNKISKYKSQILMNDSARYKQVKEQTLNKPIQAQTIMWEEAYQKMQDSLQTIGAAQKNYFDGTNTIKKEIK